MSELKYQIALSQIPKVGPITAKQLVAYSGSSEAVFHQSHRALIKIPKVGPALSKSIRSFDVDQVEPVLEAVSEHKLQTLFYLSEDFPYRLRQIPDSPLLLYVKGQSVLSRLKMIALVGTRKMTHYGRQFVDDFLEELNCHEITTVSGLALGVDHQVHMKSVELGIPSVAVLGNGLHQAYPRRNSRTAQRMLDQGAWVSEFLPGTPAAPENFPKRNRIIAGLSDVVVVVESASKGGSLITARLANEYNRDVMAVPGPISAPYSKGCNGLIKKQAAHLVESATDLIELMNWDQTDQPVKAMKRVNLSTHEQEIIDYLMQNGPSNVDSIQRSFLGQGIQLSQLLLDLELKNCISSLPGKVYQCK